MRKSTCFTSSIKNNINNTKKWGMFRSIVSMSIDSVESNSDGKDRPRSLFLQRGCSISDWRSCSVLSRSRAQGDEDLSMMDFSLHPPLTHHCHRLLGTSQNEAGSLPQDSRGSVIFQILHSDWPSNKKWQIWLIAVLTKIILKYSKTEMNQKSSLTFPSSPFCSLVCIHLFSNFWVFFFCATCRKKS